MILPSFRSFNASAISAYSLLIIKAIRVIWVSVSLIVVRKAWLKLSLLAKWWRMLQWVTISLLDTSLLYNPFNHPQLRRTISSGSTGSVSLFSSFSLLDRLT